MKFKRKSAIINLACGGFAALLLSGCDNSNGPSTVPHVFSGIEVPQEVLNEPRIVEMPPPQDISEAPYPRLGDVPSMPKTFSPQPVLDQAVSEMRQDRAEAQRELSLQKNTADTGAQNNLPNNLMPPQLPAH